MSRGHLLQTVVANRRRRAHCRLHVARIEQIPLLRGMRPDSRVAIRLQFHFHQQRVVHSPVSLLHLPHAVFCPRNFLDVMPDFVCQHICLRKFSGRSETLLQLVIKSQVYINFFVFGTVERPSGRLRTTASGLRVIPKQHQFRVPVWSSRLLRQNLLPCFLCVVQNERNELYQRLLLLISRSVWVIRARRA